MHKYHMYFIFLKIVLWVQFLLVFAQKESVNSIYYIIFDVVFNISLGIFLFMFFISDRFSGIDHYDRFVVSMAGSFLIFNTFTAGVPKLLSRFGITLPSWWPVQKG